MKIIPLSELHYFDYVQAQGDDARSFLQGQVTCNMDSLAEDQSLMGALCNLKGRVIADFRLFLAAENRIILQTRRGNGQTIVDTLSRYAVFSKVELQLIDGPEAVFGVLGESASAAFQEVLSQFPQTDNAVMAENQFLTVRIPGLTPRYQIWCQNEAALASTRQLDVMEEPATLNAWVQADIQSGILHVTPQISESYTPQLLNYDISGVIDFEKGCYTGQEVVARMHYRAKAKKRLYRLVSDAELELDSTIATSGNPDQAVAEILSVAATDENLTGSEALAILNTDLAAADPNLVVVVDGIEQAVRIASLPYSE